MDAYNKYSIWQKYFCVWGETLLQWSLAVISFFSSLPGERFTPMWCHVIISRRWLACAFVWFGVVVWLSWLTKLADTLTGKLSANKLVRLVEQTRTSAVWFAWTVCSMRVFFCLLFIYKYFVSGYAVFLAYYYSMAAAFNIPLCFHKHAMLTF